MSAIGFGPSLALRQRAGPGGVFDFTGGVLPPGATLTRASAGLRSNAAGLLVGDGVDVARFDYDAGTLAGLLLEPARINLFSASQQFDDPAWTLTGVTATADDRLAPDGTMTAERLVMTGGGTLQRTGVGSAGAALTVSLYLYTASAVSGMLFGLYDEVAGGQYLPVALPGGGWTRVVVTRTFGVGAADRRVQLLPPASGATVWAWGMQGEAAGSASSYIPTFAANAARSADMLRLALPVADGAQMLRVTFDDLSTQSVAVSVAGGSAILPPAALNRPRVRRAERL